MLESLPQAIKTTTFRARLVVFVILSFDLVITTTADQHDPARPSSPAAQQLQRRQTSPLKAELQPQAHQHPIPTIRKAT
jgi:hypothetical protein